MLRVLPIVEGHGEERAIRILLERVWLELLGATEPLDVLHPIRMPRSNMLVPGRLREKVELGARKLKQRANAGDRVFLLVVVDGDDLLGCELGPRLMADVTAQRADIASACVVAVREYETWFAASAESLRDSGYLRDPSVSERPEHDRMAKGWLKKHFHGHYSETADQPKLTARMDLALARRRSPSFDKLCRVFEALVIAPEGAVE